MFSLDLACFPRIPNTFGHVTQEELDHCQINTIIATPFDMADYYSLQSKHEMTARLVLRKMTSGTHLLPINIVISSRVVRTTGLG